MNLRVVKVNLRSAYPFTFGGPVKRVTGVGAALSLVLSCSLVAFAPVWAEDAPAVAQQDPQATFREQLRQLKWVKGPQRVELFGNSTLQVPEGYLFLNSEETDKFLTLTHNLSGGKQYFLAPDNLRWEALFNFQSDGYVKDDEKIDAVALLKSIKENTEDANKVRRERGWNEMAVDGWQTPPHYDTQSHHLEWAVNGKDLKTNEGVVNFNTRILGRGGVMSAVLLTDPDNLSASIKEFDSAITSFGYVPGQRYAEYKPGDKLAKYGLAALVTGGAAAIAVKTGLWKVILTALVAGWKFIAAGCVALFSGLAKRFGRKSS